MADETNTVENSAKSQANTELVENLAAEKKAADLEPTENRGSEETYTAGEIADAAENIFKKRPVERLSSPLFASMGPKQLRLNKQRTWSKNLERRR